MNPEILIGCESPKRCRTAGSTSNGRNKATADGKGSGDGLRHPNWCVSISWPWSRISARSIGRAASCATTSTFGGFAGCAAVIRLLPHACSLPSGERLVWEDYDIARAQLIYRGNPILCRTCPLAGTCPKQFEYGAACSETFWGMVPSHSRLARRILHQFRPRIEPGFNPTKNKYCVTDFFINSGPLAQALCIASDILETLEFLAQERPARGRETRRALSRDIFQSELWD